MSRDARRPRPNRRHGSEDAARWTAELAARYCAAPTAEARAQALQALDLPFSIDEETALALYTIQPSLSSPFVQRHLPRGRRADDARLPWTRLMAQALGRADDALHFALYRMQAPGQEWARDTGELARRIADPQALCAELERRHPQRWRSDIAPRLYALALERGQHVLPYLERHAARVWSPTRRNGYEEMVDLARRRGWWQLWATLLYACAPAAQYDREVMSLVRDTDTAEPEIRQRLLVLAGVWAPLRSTPGRASGGRMLKEETLVVLYERFAHLARGPFRAQLDPTASRPLARLIDLAIERDDDELVDYFASRLAGLVERSGAERLLQAAARVADRLAASQTDLGRRAALIVQRLPRMPRSVRQLLRRNPLAQLLFEHAGRACVQHPESAAALLRADEPRVRALAVAALTSDDPRARDAMRVQLDALLAALDHRLPSTVRRLALRALGRPTGDIGDARRVVAWARAALARAVEPELLDLVARHLSRHPALLETGEAATVHRHASPQTASSH